MAKVCYYHPSRRSEYRCEVCKKYVCGECHDSGWREAGLCNKGTICNKCDDYMIPDYAMFSMEYIKKKSTKNLILLAIFSAIGLIVGLVMGFSNGGEAGEIAAAAWVGAGIGCGIKVFLSIFYIVCIVRFKEDIKRCGFTEGIKVWFKEGLVGGLIFGFIVTFAVSLFGPLIPLYYILRRRGQIKELGILMEKYTKIFENYEKQESIPLEQSTGQLADMKKVHRFGEPILYFFN